MDDLVRLAREVRKLDRYTEIPGLGMDKEPLGEWLRRGDVLKLIDDAVRAK